MIDELYNEGGSMTLQLKIIDTDQFQCVICYFWLVS